MRLPGVRFASKRGKCGGGVGRGGEREREGKYNVDAVRAVVLAKRESIDRIISLNLRAERTDTRAALVEDFYVTNAIGTHPAPN